ncbi:putative protein DUF2809 [Leeuwenhoekiella aestuarii]|uniref:DUF2809 domain-containing protein n=1 Tax=Leeuwenhoekiella aestuarii TaxID=2249426 RepID=A0A4Q0NT40_9FLAO|nr:DUF2809 domain-containing protein [Leeuwenhoekiella aestuarii]RXG13317.1 putative protein DUF2809 [Leeuwenhoekiella aestuarii]RXG14952.1 putative protein DUF2809 [Leeuwenhoekiella aestuarii]
MIPRSKRSNYSIGFVILLSIEIAIATYLKTGFIRANLGDFLVVILLYCLLMGCSSISVKTGLLVTLVISFIIEFLQLVNLPQYQHAATLVFGSHFSWLDLLMYVFGIGFILWVEIVSPPLHPKKGV